MNKWVVLLLTVFVFMPTAHADESFVQVKSNHSVADTSARLEAVLLEKGMNVFATIDHAAGAAKAGMELSPTELVIFGNPKVGTPLMKCGPTVALDLPQKALIWEDESGQVWLAYNRPEYLAARHGLEGCDEVLAKVSKALAGFADAATQP
jgi:uncharacterized protein (DUF302 family)